MGQRAAKRARREVAAAMAEEDAYMATPYLRPTPRNLQITRTLDLGKTGADRDWHVANPGRTTLGDEPDNGYRDALGPVKDNVGRTIVGRDWQ